MLCGGSALGLKSLPSVRIVVLALSKDGPNDAGVFVGDGNQSFVVADARVHARDPLLQSRAFFGSAFEGGLQGRAGALREQAAKIRVAAFGDDAEPLLTTGASLSGHEPSPSSELATVAKIGGVGNRCDHGAGGERSYAAQGADPLRGEVALGVGMDFPVTFLDALLKKPDLLIGLQQQWTHAFGSVRFLVC